MRRYFRRTLNVVRSLSWSGLLAGLMILLLAAACGNEESGQAVEVPTQTPVTTPSTTPTAIPTVTQLPPATATSAPPPTTSPSAPTRPHSPDIAPPLAVLSAQAGDQEATLGTYCWEEGGQGLCADFSGLPIPEAVLSVQVGEQLIISVPGADQLVNVIVEAYDFSSAQVEFGEAMLIYPPRGAIAIPFKHDGPTVSVTADVPPGEYVVSAFVGFPEEGFVPSGSNDTASSVRGDAMYGFHIEVVEASP